MGGIGGFDELMFIDYVDYDYCERLIKAGWNIVQTPKAVLSHYVGVSRQEKLFGITVNVMNHSAFRKYYQARNWIYWQRKMGRFSLVASLKHSMWWSMIVLLYEKDKWRKLRAIAHGTHSALFDKRFL